jgi:hypothetical protein
MYQKIRNYVISEKVPDRLVFAGCGRTADMPLTATGKIARPRQFAARRGPEQREVTQIGVCVTQGDLALHQLGDDRSAVPHHRGWTQREAAGERTIDQEHPHRVGTGPPIGLPAPGNACFVEQLRHGIGVRDELGRENRPSAPLDDHLVVAFAGNDESPDETNLVIS